MEILKHIFHLLIIAFLGVAAFLYPTWIRDGYLEDWYPKFGAFIAIYGGLVGSVVWYIQNRKNL